MFDHNDFGRTDGFVVYQEKVQVQLIQSLACFSHVYVGENKWSSQMGIFHATLLFFYAPQGCSYLQRR